MKNINNYIGRFAPSPTGLLHIGSLLTAFASYADAKAHGGKWLVRMEDLDPLREMAGAADDILYTLEQFGFEWDGSVIYQSQRHHLYQAALNDLYAHNWVYPCSCSRKEWHSTAQMGIDGFVYNGKCRHQTLSPDKAFFAHLAKDSDNPIRQPESQAMAWRMRVEHQTIAFNDRIVGHYAQNLAQDIGDFVLLRADGFWAYQLAVVVDDAQQGITHIVRGQDLLVSTPRQIHLQHCLNLPTPSYAHLPLLTNAQGQKWSKQTLAPALDLSQREHLLRQVMRYLNLPLAPEVDNLADLLAFAVVHWQLERIPQHTICTE